MMWVRTYGTANGRHVNLDAASMIEVGFSGGPHVAVRFPDGANQRISQFYATQEEAVAELEYFLQGLTVRSWV